MADSATVAQKRNSLCAKGPRLTDELIGEVLNGSAHRGQAALSVREHEIADLIAIGLTNSEIAQSLVISTRTVESHVDHIKTKLGFARRAHIVAWALERPRVDHSPHEESGKLPMTTINPRRKGCPVPPPATAPQPPPPLEAVTIKRGLHRIHAREQPGDEPTILLMHGYPDNHHLYDRLIPHLPGRHVVVFDFLGWGESDKPADHDYTFDNLTGDLDAVVTGLGLNRIVLVPHDGSGPPAINWALDHPDHVAAIVALNTFYCDIPGSPLNPPEAIRLFSDPNYARLATHFAASPTQFRWLYDFQVGGFIQDDQIRQQFVPLLFRQFEDEPSTIGPFLQLNTDLIPAVLAATDRRDELSRFNPPVRVAFGAHDTYLSPAYGAALAALFAHGEATPIAGAGHFPQLDTPAPVATSIVETLTAAGRPAGER